MRTSNIFLRAAVLFALVGLLMGIGMAAHHDFRLTPTHAHINLLGWASMFLYGLFYRVVPGAGAERLATWHLYAAIGGLLLMAPGIAAVNLGHLQAEPLIVVGSLLTVLGMVLFTIVVFRHSRSTAAAPVRPAPAE